MKYEVKDIILPDLDLSNPCPVKVEVTDKYIYLYVGDRDWQWDAKTGECIGQGTRIDAP